MSLKILLFMSAGYNLNALQTIILLIMEANTMNPDQTASKVQSDLGTYCLQYTTKVHM